MSDNAFMVMTEYQLFNVLRIVSNNCELTKKNSDLFIGSNNIKNVELIVKELKEAKLFNNIYIVNKIKYPKNRIISKFKFGYILLFKNSFKKMVSCELSKYYKKIWIADLASAMFFFSRYYNKADIFLYEDGMGSYTDNVLEIALKGSRIKKILFGKRHTDMLYVNNIDLCKNKTVKSIKQIPNSFDSNDEKKLDCIFEDEKKIDYGLYDAIYLEQPVEEFGENFSHIQEEVLACTKGCYGGKLITRIHPRDREKYADSEYAVDITSTLWEELCCHSIKESHILISFYSTGVFNPKILGNCEPIIILLYKCLPFDAAFAGEIDSFVQDFIELYDDKNKIIIPESMEEYKQILSERILLS